MKGLEPLLREKLDPKSSASTNSATPACVRVFEGAKIQLFYECWIMNAELWMMLHINESHFIFYTFHSTLILDIQSFA